MISRFAKVSFILGILCLTATAKAQIFEDTFQDQNIDDWLLFGNAPTVAAGLVRFNTPGSMIAPVELPTDEGLIYTMGFQFPDPSVSNQQIRLILNQTNDNEPLQGTKDSYFVQLDSEVAGWRLSIVERRGWDETVLGIVPVSGDLTLSTAFTQSVLIDDGAISVKIMDPLKTELASLDVALGAPFVAGPHVALFKNGNGVVAFDHLVVERADPACRVSLTEMGFDWPTASERVPEVNGNGRVDVTELIARVNCSASSEDTFNVVVNAQAGGSVDPNGVQRLMCGDDLTVTATAANGFVFTGWSGDVTGAQNPLELTDVCRDLAITATFAEDNGNAPPVADAGADFSGSGGMMVTLDGSGSSDDVGIVAYAWQQLGGDEVVLQNAASAIASFVAPQVVETTVLSFQLTVTDGGGLSSTDVVSVSLLPPGVGLIDCAVGIVGDAPSGEFSALTTLSVTNDRNHARPCELVYGGVPLGRDLALSSTNRLVLVDSNGQHIAAQFTATSRWNANVDDSTEPIRWLEVAFVSGVEANSTADYTLRLYNDVPAFNDTNAATISANGNLFDVETGAVTYTLDPANPALFDAITMDLGGVATDIYRHVAGAGPRLVLDQGITDLTLDTSQANQVRVDGIDGFRIVQQGPVKVVVALQGHFSDPDGSTLCGAANPAYEAYGFTMIATFVRGASDVWLQFHFRNECSDAFSGPFTDNIANLREVAWVFPIADLGNVARFAGDAAIVNHVETQLEMTQMRGGGTPWLRRAALIADGNTIHSATAYDAPLVGLTSGSVLAAISMPWMRFREPQALAVSGRNLILEPVSEDLILGEGKGLWQFAKLSLREASDDVLGQLAELQQAAAAELERGLVPRPALDFVNASAVLPSLGDGQTSAAKTTYAGLMNMFHHQTVDPGGQWDRSKTFGSQHWPDVQRDRWTIDFDNPESNNVAMNYWNPSGAELLEFLRTGDPKWLWDFALPQSWLQMHTAYLNIGNQTHGNRGGFAVTGGGTGEGQWHRSGFGSTDYSYNAGMHLAYALRPNVAFRDRFAAQGNMVENRFNVPWAQEDLREDFVNKVVITRQMVQYYEGLANAAEFVPGSDGQGFEAKLRELVTELANDNLSQGMMCQPDVFDPNYCSQPQQFMINSMMFLFFHRYLRNYGDIDGLIQAGLVGTAQVYADFALAYNNQGNIELFENWASRLGCSIVNGEVAECDWLLDSDNSPNLLLINKPHTLAMLLIAHELDPTVDLCGVVQQAMSDPDFGTLFTGHIANQSGWFKGANQMMQGMAFGIGIFDTCTP